MSPLKRLQLQNYNFTVETFYVRSDGSDHWVLDAPYQRGRLWSEEQNRNLIKSLLRGIPIGVIFGNRRGWNEANIYIVDGKQRIGAIRDFVEGRLEVPASWFERVDLQGGVNMEGGVTYSDLSARGERHFNSCTVAVYESRLESVQAEAELYLLVNFGGVAQSEIDRERALEVAEAEVEPPAM